MDLTKIEKVLAYKHRRQLLFYLAESTQPQRTNEIGQILALRYQLKFRNRQSLLFNLHRLKENGLVELYEQIIKFKDEKKKRKKMRDGRKIFTWKISGLGLEVLKNRYGLGLK